MKAKYYMKASQDLSQNKFIINMINERKFKDIQVKGYDAFDKEILNENINNVLSIHLIYERDYKYNYFVVKVGNNHTIENIKELTLELIENEGLE